MRTTVTLPDDLAAHVDDVRASPDDPDAQAVRECVRRSQNLEKCQQERDHLQARVDDLERQLMHANQRIGATNEIVRYAEEERSDAARWRRAGMLTRMKWRVFGMDDGDE